MNDILELISLAKARRRPASPFNCADGRRVGRDWRLQTEKDHVSACSAVVAQAARAVELRACCSVAHKRDTSRIVAAIGRDRIAVSLRHHPERLVWWDRSRL